MQGGRTGKGARTEGGLRLVEMHELFIEQLVMFGAIHLL